MAKFSIKKRIQSFKYAFKGIIYFLKNEHNAWIHTLVAFIVIILGFWLKVSSAEWLFLIFAIGFVFVAEALNTSLENLANSVTSEENNFIGNAKDIAAGAVFIAAITAAIVGLIVFIPHLMEKITL